MRFSPGRSLTTVVMTLALLAPVAGCASVDTPASGTDGPGGGGRELTLAAYSIPGKAYQRIIPAFQTEWESKTGERVTFVESYGGSGSQARAVIDGLDADVVHLAMEPDIAKLVDSGLIEPGWKDRSPRNGVPTTSLMVFGTREGNPRNLSDWADITATGIGIITPNPRTSGGAQWNLLAAWGSAAFAPDGSETLAYDRVKRIYANTLVLDKNARDATNTFLRKGLGDVALLWESDALIARSEGERLDIVIPRTTILAETAVAVVDSNVRRRGTQDVAQAFVEFLFTPEAQRIFAEEGLRPVDEQVLAASAEKYPTPENGALTIADFGGWSSAGTRFFSTSGVYARIEADAAKAK